MAPPGRRRGEGARTPQAAAQVPSQQGRVDRAPVPQTRPANPALPSLSRWPRFFPLQNGLAALTLWSVITTSHRFRQSHKARDAVIFQADWQEVVEGVWAGGQEAWALHSPAP